MQIRLDTPDDGLSIDWLGQRVRLPIRTSDTSGRFSAQLGTIQPNFFNPPHVHTREDEVFYVLEGELTLRVADRKLTLHAGELAYAPAGLPHQVFNRTNKPTKTLVLLTGDTIEQAFLDAAGKTPSEIAPVMAQAGVKILDSFEPTYRPTGFESLSSDAIAVSGSERNESFWLAGDTYTVLLSGAQSRGQLAVVHFDIPAGGGPIPHVHTRDFEAFFITAGEIELYADGEIVTGRPGDVAVLPENIPHCFKNRTDKRAEMIAVVAPSGFDQFLRQAGIPAIRGKSAPAVDEAEKQRLVAASPDFGIILRPDIAF